MNDLSLYGLIGGSFRLAVAGIKTVRCFQFERENVSVMEDSRLETIIAFVFRLRPSSIQGPKDNVQVDISDTE